MKPASSPSSRGVAKSELTNHSSQGSTSVEPAQAARTTLGNYRLIRKLGSGGMANVYLGQRADSAGRVQLAAVKVMLPQLAEDPHSLDLFFDEARVTSLIRHPSVCKVLDFGVDDGAPYLATEYVMGEMLGDVISALHSDPRSRAAASALSAYIIGQACEGVHAAHEACDEEGKPLRIIHRDIAPQNIMVGYDGRVRVLDFGIARSADQQHETQHGVLRGRFAYMAPEQMEGGMLDRRADIWSLGVLLWEAASGERLFRRDTVSETVRAVLAAPITSSLLAAEVPGPLLDVIERAVVREPSRRYPTARKMSDDLAALTSTGASQLQATMRRVFAARFEAKKQLLGKAARVSQFIVSDGTGYRSVSSHPKTDSGLEPSQDPSTTQSMSSTGSVITYSNPPTMSGIREMPREAEVAAALQSSAPPVQKAAPAATRKVIASAVVAATVVVSLFAFDHSRTARMNKSTPHERVERVVEAARPTAQNAAPPGDHQALAFGEIVVSGANGAKIRVDGVEVGSTPTRLALPEGHHVVELWSGPPGLPVVMPVEVSRGKALSISLPVSPVSTPLAPSDGR